MNNKILRELCELAYESCKIELDGQKMVDTDKLPGVLLALIDAYTFGTSKAIDQVPNRESETDNNYCPVCAADLSYQFDKNGKLIAAGCVCGYQWIKGKAAE